MNPGQEVAPTSRLVRKFFNAYFFSLLSSPYISFEFLLSLSLVPGKKVMILWMMRDWLCISLLSSNTRSLTFLSKVKTGLNCLLLPSCSSWFIISFVIRDDLFSGKTSVWTSIMYTNVKSHWSWHKETFFSWSWERNERNNPGRGGWRRNPISLLK